MVRTVFFAPKIEYRSNPRILEDVPDNKYDGIVDMLNDDRVLVSVMFCCASDRPFV